MATRNTNNSILAFILVILVGVGVYWLMQPDRRTGGERLGDAVEALPQGVDKAAHEFKDRTPGEKIGDAVKEAGENIKENSAQ